MCIYVWLVSCMALNIFKMALKKALKSVKFNLKMPAETLHQEGYKYSVSLSLVPWTTGRCGRWIIELPHVLTEVWLGWICLCTGVRSWDVDLTACNIDEQLKLFISRHSACVSEDLKGKKPTIYERFTLVLFWRFHFLGGDLWNFVGWKRSLF